MKNNKEISHDETDISRSLKDVLLILGFAARSLKRHRLLAFMCFAATVGLCAALLSIMPRTYKVSTRILTHPSYIIPSLTHPDRRIPFRAQQGTLNARELVKSQKNLIRVVSETQLVERWQQTRTFIGRTKDSIYSYIFDPLTNEEIQDALLNILDDKLHVKVDQNVIIIAAEWHDPDTAKLLVEALMQSFLEEQRSRELREFNEPILILNKKLTEAKTRYHDAMGRSNDKKTEEQPKKDVYAKRKYLSKKHKIDVPPKNIDVEEIELELALKKEEIARLERTYKKRLQKAKNDLEELQITLGPQHPDYVKAARYYSILSSNPPRLGGLYTEEERLTRELENSQKSKVRIPRFNAIARPIKDNGKKDVSFQEYRQAEITYHTLVERLENARMELEAAEAAFNYRFRVTKPPEYPMRPLKPNSAKIILVGVFLGIFLGLFMAIFTDVRSGIILESWQLSRMLKIPVFGEIDEP